ncbi:uncharacterized protein [Clytia hemisphaerica]|uniref:uncharacterized protein n=1 Tax=Clytia hemisphaerica TaxID=252671 RepID=UPI0034D5199E
MNCAPEKQKNPSEETWKSFEETAKLWQDVESEYSEVHDKINWESGAIGVFWHKNCKLSLMNRKSFEKASRRLENLQNKQNEEPPPVSRRRIKKYNCGPRYTRKSIGVIHRSDVCIWCGKGHEPKHKRVLQLMDTPEIWDRFKNCIGLDKDTTRRARLRRLVESLGSEKEIPNNIRYHSTCYRINL